MKNPPSLHSDMVPPGRVVGQGPGSLGLPGLTVGAERYRLPVRRGSHSRQGPGRKVASTLGFLAPVRNVFVPAQGSQATGPMGYGASARERHREQRRPPRGQDVSGGDREQRAVVGEGRAREGARERVVGGRERLGGSAGGVDEPRSLLVPDRAVEDDEPAVAGPRQDPLRVVREPLTTGRGVPPPGQTSRSPLGTSDRSSEPLADAAARCANPRNSIDGSPARVDLGRAPANHADDGELGAEQRRGHEPSAGKGASSRRTHRETS